MGYASKDFTAPSTSHLGAAVSVTTNAVQFGSVQTSVGLIVVTAPIANTVPVYLGRSVSVTTALGIEINPGDSITLPCANANEYFAIASTSASLRFLAL